MFFLLAKTPLGQALTGILTGIGAVVAQRAPRSTICALLLQTLQRLRRLNNRFDQLVERWQAGTLPPSRPSQAGATRPTRPRAPTPNRPSWLTRLVQPTAQYAGQLDAFLADPRTQELAAAAPQAGRLLRPLCRGLGLTPPPWLRLPKRTPTPQPPKPRATPAPGEPPATPDRPLPAYILAAARAWRKNAT